MQNTIQTLPITSWVPKPTSELQEQAIQQLETGHVLFFPNLDFSLQADEKPYLSANILSGKRKNVSYLLNAEQLSGAQLTGQAQRVLQNMMHRYACQTRELLNQLFPHYATSLIQARTSFRPKEIAGRVLSLHKDDTKLHVDAFPANPVQGKRILRVFSNINPQQMPRLWHVGEPFDKVVEYFLPRLKRPRPGLATLQHWLRITKKKRTPYDHYMLQLHDRMKEDAAYQAKARSGEFNFPAQSTWIVFTDQVSHAALKGQHILEQSFYLPIESMRYKQYTPLSVLEKYIGQKLA